MNIDAKTNTFSGWSVLGDLADENAAKAVGRTAAIVVANLKSEMISNPFPMLLLRTHSMKSFDY